MKRVKVVWKFKRELGIRALLYAVQYQKCWVAHTPIYEYRETVVE
jgi:hypothetical protein